MMTNTNNILNYEDPGAMDEQLFQVPGMVNELMNVTMANAPRPNKPLAFMGALAAVAHLAGRSYADEHGTHANMYLVALAPTGMGKDEPRLTNQKLMNSIGAMGSVPDTIASPEGLEDALLRSPALLLQNDEADSLFGAMSSSGLRSAKLNSAILRLYSLSKGVLVTRLKARELSPTIIEKPHLTLFATGVPEYVYKSLSPKALTDGLMGRCLFIETNEFCRLGVQQNLQLPESIIEAAKWMRNQSSVLVKATPEAKALIEEMKTKCDDLAEAALKRDLFVASALLCRFCEKAMKLAMIGAISENPYDPTITADAVTWAAQFVTYATKQMLSRSAFYVAEGKFGKLKAHALALLKHHNGTIDRSTLLKNLAVSLNTFKQLIATLIASELIEAEAVSNGKTLYHSVNAN